MKLPVAVDDAGQPLDTVGAQAFPQGLDDRDATGDRCLEGHHHPFLGRGAEDLVAVHGDQRLVGGHDMLAVGDRFHHQLIGHVIATDQFDQHIDLGVARDLEDVMRAADAGDIAVRVVTTSANLFDDNRASSTTRNLIGHCVPAR